MITVIGQVCSPLSGENPFRVGQDGLPRILPGSGGIVLSHRVGDPCIGLAADHVEPGVSIRNEQRSIKSPEGSNQALQTYSCVGNWAMVVSGPCNGARGVVTGKHGGVDTVLVDFPLEVMRRMRIGDRVQVYAYGLGLRLLDHPAVTVINCAPRLIGRLGLRHTGKRLGVAVTHIVPSRIMGSGLGRNNAHRGDYDIQLFDHEEVRRHDLSTLRFGDIVAITNADSRYGRSFLRGHVTIGVVVHSESTVAGHGPGVVTLLTGPSEAFSILRDRRANIAGLLDIRAPRRARGRAPMTIRDAAQAHRSRRALPLPAANPTR